MDFGPFWILSKKCNDFASEDTSRAGDNCGGHFGFVVTYLTIEGVPLYMLCVSSVLLTMTWS
jgi:hypothetical protein